MSKLPYVFYSLVASSSVKLLIDIVLNGKLLFAPFGRYKGVGCAVPRYTLYNGGRRKYLKLIANDADVFLLRDDLELARTVVFRYFRALGNVKRVYLYRRNVKSGESSGAFKHYVVRLSGKPVYQVYADEKSVKKLVSFKEVLISVSTV